MDVGAAPLGLASGRRTKMCHIRPGALGAEPVPSLASGRDGPRICAISRDRKRCGRRSAATRRPAQTAKLPKNRLTAFGPAVEKEDEGSLNIGRRLAIGRDCGRADRRTVRGTFDKSPGAEARHAGAGALAVARIRRRTCGRSAVFGSAFPSAASFAGLLGVAGPCRRTRARDESLDEGGETCAALLEL